MDMVMVGRHLPRPCTAEDTEQGRWPRATDETTNPGYMSGKKSKVSNGEIRYVTQTEILTHATHVTGWCPPVYMSCMSQIFRLCPVSNLSVRNCRIFQLMYPGSTDRDNQHGRRRRLRRVSQAPNELPGPHRRTRVTQLCLRQRCGSASFSYPRGMTRMVAPGADNPQIWRAGSCYVRY